MRIFEISSTLIIFSINNNNYEKKIVIFQLSNLSNSNICTPLSNFESSLLTYVLRLGWNSSCKYLNSVNVC